MTQPAEDLRWMVRSAEVLALDRCRLEGQEVSLGEVPAESSALEEMSAVEVALAHRLYHRFYAREEVQSTFRDPLAQRDHLHRLSRANAGEGTWESGWKIRAVEEEEVCVERDGLRFWTDPSRVRGSSMPGRECRVRVGKELRDVSGYYMALGDGGSEDLEEGATIVRIYWHLVADAAVGFLATLTRRLNPTGLPYQVKVLADPERYRRADAGVLYLGKIHYEPLRPLLHEVLAELGPGSLRPEVPRLVKVLAPGVGVAEDPGGDRSFGLHRCSLLSRGLWRAFEGGKTLGQDRWRTVVEVFEAAGFDPHRPYLEPGSEDVYSPWAARPSNAPPSDSIHSASPSESLTSEESAALFLAAARRIGEDLCRRAIRHDDRCTWWGRSSDEASSVGGPLTPRVRTLGADFYGGCSGVAWFLAHLAASDGDEAFRTTALGGLRQAFARREGLRWPLGVFEGRLGVLYAGWRVARLLDEDELLDEVRRHFDVWLGEGHGDDHPLDLISGHGGAIPVLLEFHRAGFGDRCLDVALRLGQEIRRSAQPRHDAWAWDTRRSTGVDMGPDPLTGLSHGACGLGLALLELGASLGEAQWVEEARCAFDYERALFDEARGNWPDLRQEEGVEEARTFAVAWCHGAPGIVLSRLRALELDSQRASVYREEIRAGCRPIIEALDSALDEKRPDTSLCHGLTGWAEVLAAAGHVLEEEVLEDKARHALVGMCHRFGERLDWPSGVPSKGWNPSLMLGVSGVGITLLRAWATEAGHEKAPGRWPGAWTSV